jgi:predicted RNA-binding Zn-ribbon protein involved in translation (DUF1610 family)
MCGDLMSPLEFSIAANLDLGCSCDVVPTSSTSSSWECATCGEFQVTRA